MLGCQENLNKTPHYCLSSWRWVNASPTYRYIDVSLVLSLAQYIHICLPTLRPGFLEQLWSPVLRKLMLMSLNRQWYSKAQVHYRIDMDSPSDKKHEIPNIIFQYASSWPWASVYETPVTMITWLKIVWGQIHLNFEGNPKRKMPIRITYRITLEISERGLYLSIISFRLCLYTVKTAPHDDVIKWKLFRVTGPLCGEFTGPGEFPAQRPVTRSFDVFFDLRLNKRLSK